MGQEGTRHYQCDARSTYDYGSKIEYYPMIQAYFRPAEIPVLLLCGTPDQYLSTQAAGAYKRDVHNVAMRSLDGGHWILQSNGGEVNETIQDLLSRHI